MDDGAMVEMIERAMRGDEDALTQLLEDHGPVVRRHIGFSLGAQWQSAIDVDDIMQVTYVEAFLRIGRLESRTAAGFGAWLRQIAKNNMLDAIRALEAEKRPSPRQRVRNSALGGPDQNSYMALVEVLGATSKTPSREAAAQEAQVFLEKALGELPDDYEKVIRLYDLEMRPASEVAIALGRSEGAVYMLRARAHDCLRDVMGKPSKFFTHWA